MTGNACPAGDATVEGLVGLAYLKGFTGCRASGSGGRLEKFCIGDESILGKTGTSFGFRDAWAVGVNAEYVIGVWVGNADGEGRPGLVGTRAAAPILFEVASLLHTSQRFYEPAEELVSIKVCRRSGFRASECCPDVDTIRACEAGLPDSDLPLSSSRESGCYRTVAGKF